MRRLLLPLLLVLALAAPATATSGNPLAGHRLGVNSSSDAGNKIYTSWATTSGQTKRLYAKMGPRSRVRWYGAWTGTGAKLTDKIRRYVANTQKGDRSVVAPMAFFRLWPRSEADRRALSLTDQRLYRQWYAAAARGIGSSHAVIVLEPDLPLVLPRHKTADTGVRKALVRYAVRTLAALPNTTVYLDGGDGDWLSVAELTDLLADSGVEHVRGFALGATHYAPTATQISYGRQVSLALAKRGIRGKRFVVDTADNGRPFTHAQYSAMQRSGARKNHFDNADVCRNLTQTACVTLGIPPTTDTANARWRFSATIRTYARGYADAFLWFGRPWLKMQADPYCPYRALQAARTTPWQRTATIPQVSARTYAAQQAKCFRRP